MSNAILKIDQDHINELIQLNECLGGLVDLIRHKNKINKEERDTYVDSFPDEEWDLGLVRVDT